MKDLLEKGIQDLSDISDLFQDFETYTEDSKEEELLNEIVESIDNYRYFLKSLLKNMDKQGVVLDQGYEYMLGIRENVSHRI